MGYGLPGEAHECSACSLAEMIEDRIIVLEKRKGEILNLNALKELIIQ